MKFERLGWIIAATLLGGIVGMGFRAPGDKTGTVDLARVFNESEYAKKQTESLRNMGSQRQAIVEFLRTYPHLKSEDAVKFRELSLKVTPTPADKAEQERIKNDAQASEQKYRDLTTKSGPTQAELTQLDDLNRRQQTNGQNLQKWNEEFAGELQQRQESLRNETLQRVREAVQQVGKDQGYSIVFVQDVAPYSSNDVTGDALKAMNAKK